MLRYKCATLRENEMPVLKPNANDKLLFVTFTEQFCKLQMH
jgi:hypothetical protein